MASQHKQPTATGFEDTSLLRFENVQYSAAGKTILQDINFSIFPEEITTVIGPNGAGKSTLVKLATGLLTSSEGKVARSRNCPIGYMPQKITLDSSMPIKLSRFLSLADADKLARQEVAALLGISERLGSQMTELSGGEFQRALLARAILRKPKLLVLDEPLQGVDIAGQTELYQLIGSLRERLGCAILMISHDLHLVMAQTDKVICLNQHICCHGHAESVSQHPEYLKLFGKQSVDNLAVYTHHHDHHHTVQGGVESCDEHCKHD